MYLIKERELRQIVRKAYMQVMIEALKEQETSNEKQKKKIVLNRKNNEKKERTKMPQYNFLLRAKNYDLDEHG